MEEIENGGERQDNIRNLVDDALIPKSGEVNELLDEHDNLAHEARVLKNRLADKRRETAVNDDFETDMYAAAYHLADALDFVLNEAPDVSQNDPENDQFLNSSNVGRDMFINSIRRTLNHLGMDGKAVKELLIQQDDNQDK